ncbi:hypothetical protein GKF79_25975, partial [Escherichia coli]|nr:hypothetical protein [Escherichia coli]
DTCGLPDDQPLETEVDLRRRSSQPLEMGFEYRSAVRTVRTDATGLIIPASSE